MFRADPYGRDPAVLSRYFAEERQLAAARRRWRPGEWSGLWSSPTIALLLKPTTSSHVALTCSTT